LEKLKQSVLAVLTIAVFFLTMGLLMWLVGQDMATALFFAFASLKTLYSATFGQMKKALPGLRSIDYILFIIMSALLVNMPLSFGSPLAPLSAVLLVVSLLVWSFVGMFRWPYLRAGSSVPIDELFRQKSR
jgi:hypothetical protein